MGRLATVARIAMVSRPAISFPQQRPSERLADLCVLGGGLVLGLAAAPVLLVAALGRGGLGLAIGTGFYVAGLLAMLGCSLLYRAAIEPRQRQFLRRLDHAAIFALIAGTATPFALSHGGDRGIILTVALWAAAAVGMIVKLSFPIMGIGRSVLIYLLLGWASLPALGPTVSHQTLELIVAGGGFYSVGVWFMLWRQLPYRLAIWHTFVLAGAICHYLAIMIGVVLA
jgi:hemolysin III